MSIFFMQEVVRICDRYLSADNTGYLKQILVLVLIFHMIMGVSFMKMEEYERKHPRIVREVDVSFLCSAPPPAPEFRVGEIPRPIQLTPGLDPDAGGEASARPHSEKTSLPTPKADKTHEQPAMEQANQTVSRVRTEAPPISRSTFDNVKSDPTMIASSIKKTPLSQLFASIADSPVSGDDYAGGRPSDDSENGVGVGGHGSSKDGNGKDGILPGSGSGSELVGGEEKVTLKVEHLRAMGDISRYRFAVLAALAKSYHPSRKSEPVTVRFEIGKDGELLHVEILSSSGNRKTDKEALEAVENTQFPPHPDWYKGQTLTFQIDLGRMEDAR